MILTAMFGIILIGIDLLTKKWWWNPQFNSLNQGSIYGIFPGIEWVLILFILWLVILRMWWISKNAREQVGWTYILAGGLANILDRVWFGGVRDFICYPIINVCGNMADIWLSIGVILLIYLNHQMWKVNNRSELN